MFVHQVLQGDNAQLQGNTAAGIAAAAEPGAGQVPSHISCGDMPEAGEYSLQLCIRTLSGLGVIGMQTFHGVSGDCQITWNLGLTMSFSCLAAMSFLCISDCWSLVQALDRDMHYSGNRRLVERGRVRHPAPMTQVIRPKGLALESACEDDTCIHDMLAGFVMHM